MLRRLRELLRAGGPPRGRTGARHGRRPPTGSAGARIGAMAERFLRRPR